MLPPLLLPLSLSRGVARRLSPLSCPCPAPVRLLSTTSSSADGHNDRDNHSNNNNNSNNDSPSQGTPRGAVSRPRPSTPFRFRATTTATATATATATGPPDGAEASSFFQRVLSQRAEREREGGSAALFPATGAGSPRVGRSSIFGGGRGAAESAAASLHRMRWAGRSQEGSQEEWRAQLTSEERKAVQRFDELYGSNEGDADSFVQRSLTPLLMDPAFGMRMHHLTQSLFPMDPSLKHAMILKAERVQLEDQDRELMRRMMGFHEDNEQQQQENEKQQDQEDAVVYERQVIDEQGRTRGTGRRKTSTARVVLIPTELGPESVSKVIVNGKPLAQYFPRMAHRETALEPFSVLPEGTVDQFNIVCLCSGGGLSGQAGAISLGITRALLNANPEWREALKEGGFFTRDPRMVERKKPGQKKARKKFQWVKR